MPVSVEPIPTIGPITVEPSEQLEKPKPIVAVSVEPSPSQGRSIGVGQRAVQPTQDAVQPMQEPTKPNVLVQEQV